MSDSERAWRLRKNRSHYRPDEIPYDLKTQAIREATAVASFLHDADICTLEEVVEATGLTPEVVRSYIQKFIMDDAAEEFEDGRIEWYG